MKLLKPLVVFLFIAFTTGCAVTPQAPVDLKPAFWKSPSKKVGVVMTKVPKLDMTYPGAGCLLCYAAAAAMNSTLSSHVKTLDNEHLPELNQEIAKDLKAKGMEPVVIDTPLDLDNLPSNSSSKPGAARKDFSSFKKKYGISHLVVINVTFLGMQRNYSSYIPTGAPRGVFEGQSFLVNLDDNTYEWYLPVNVYKGVTDKWDEPPAYPALTNAYYQALATGKDTILGPFVN